MSEWDAGVVADPHDEEAIEEALLALWRRWQDGGLPDQEQVRARALEQYSRQANAARLAERARRGTPWLSGCACSSPAG